MDFEKIKKDIEAIFWMTQNKIITTEECRLKLNDFRKELGCIDQLTKEDFTKFFTAEGRKAEEKK